MIFNVINITYIIYNEKRERVSFVSEWKWGKGFLPSKQKETSNCKSNVLSLHDAITCSLNKLIVLRFKGRAVRKGRAELVVRPAPRGELWINFSRIASDCIREIKLIKLYFEEKHFSSK